MFAVGPVYFCSLFLASTELSLCWSSLKLGLALMSVTSTVINSKLEMHSVECDICQLTLYTCCN